MKVHKCAVTTPAPVVTPAFLTYEQIMQKEGVYKNFDGVSWWRVLVIKHETSTVPAVALFHGIKTDSLEPLCDWAKTSKFIKVENATVCFEIKEA